MNRGYFSGKNRLTRLFAGSMICALIFALSFSRFCKVNFTQKVPTQKYLVQLEKVPDLSYHFWSGETTTGIDDFDAMIARDGGQIEDLFAANDGEQGKWIVVTGNEQLEADLYFNLEDGPYGAGSDRDSY